MARPIKETPILTGRDAVNFYKQMKIAETKKISPEKLAEMRESAAKLKAIER